MGCRAQPRGSDVDGDPLTLPASIAYIRAGKLRALAVSTLKRSPALPELPSVSEYVPGHESSGFFGVGAPGKTPSEIVDKLNEEINAGLAQPRLKATCRPRRHGAFRLAGRFQDAHCRRNPEMGQGNPRRQHQGGMSAPSARCGAAQQ
jgi:tripartite-type tricarboxylate transporter receptor subunit TctC